ncbi:MAG: hypothetical protein JWN14_2472 [Chthonomonadales bacterium]|nr:hypothetical protein [Chthonomonadales bacterium]
MPDIGASQGVHNDVFLTNVSVAYRNQSYVAPMVFPICPVPKRTDKYAVYKSDTFLRASGLNANGRPQSLRRPGTRSQQITWDVSNQSYSCEEFARNYPITDAERKLADSPISIEVDTTESLTDTIMLDNEIQVANKAMLRSNYASANKVQLVTTTTSWAAATGKPLSVDIPNGKRAVKSGTLKAANAMALNYNASIVLSQNAEYVDRFKYTSKETVTNAGLIPNINGLEIVESDTMKATSAENATTFTAGYCWTDDQSQDAALIYLKPAAVGLKMVALGLTFECPDDTTGASGFTTQRWREPWIKSDVIEVATNRDFRFTSTDGSTNGDNASGYATGGYLISGPTL